MSAAEEIWREVPGEYRLFASSMGRVKRRHRELTVFVSTSTGYPSVSVQLASGKQHESVHVLMLRAFAGPRPAAAVGRHLDDNRTHNVIENLAWGSRTENALDAVRNGTHYWASRTHCKWGHEYTAENTRWLGRTRLCITCKKRTALAYWRRKQHAA